MEYKHIKHLL